MAISRNFALFSSNSTAKPLPSQPAEFTQTLGRRRGSVFSGTRGTLAGGGLWGQRSLCATLLGSALVFGCAPASDDGSAELGINNGSSPAKNSKKTTDTNNEDNSSSEEQEEKPKWNDEFPGGEDDDKGGPAESATLSECDKIDLVFVIDDSRSMQSSQEALIADFPNFIKVLNDYRTKEGRPLDYRVAVTTSSVSHTMHPLLGPAIEHTGDDGKFRTTNGVDQRSCLEGDDKWIEHDDPELTERFSCIAEVGTEGLGIEMQMLALNLSVSDRIESGDNKGFLRKDALLAAVILTDEDDCSVEDQDLEPGLNFTQCLDGVNLPNDIMQPERSVELLDNAKQKERARWALGVLVNDTLCTPGPNGPKPGPPKKRLKGLADTAGDNAVYVPICEGNFADSLNTVLDTFTEACEEFPPPK